MEINELLALNSEGLIPGPGETEECFCERVRRVKENYINQKEPIALHHWQWSFERLRALYDFSPRWCSAFYSSKGLALWQAAATWIDVKRVYSIQLRQNKWLSWLVDRDELLSHEAVHAARAAFNEPKTEEMLAYLTSNTKWRQVIGPLFQKPLEALIFLSFVGLGAFLQMAEVLWDSVLGSSVCFFISACLLFGWGVRLVLMRRRLILAARKLSPMLRDPKMVRAVLFRLTDKEIIDLANGKSGIEKNELRWQLLREAYFHDFALRCRVDS